MIRKIKMLFFVFMIIGKGWAPLLSEKYANTVEN